MGHPAIWLAVGIGGRTGEILEFLRSAQNDNL